MYYHTLLQKSDKELVKRVFSTRQKFYVKVDWILALQKDLAQCDIQFCENEIRSMKKKKEL